jgi:transposase
MTAGRVSDYTGASALLSSLPSADWLLGDRGYDAHWFREALIDKKISPCIPDRTSREKPVKYDKRRYRKRNRIEIMFGRLKDWRRVATRYDRSPNVFLSAIALAATVIFWLGVLSLESGSSNFINKISSRITRENRFALPTVAAACQISGIYDRATNGGATGYGQTRGHS